MTVTEHQESYDILRIVEEEADRFEHLWTKVLVHDERPPEMVEYVREVPSTVQKSLIKELLALELEYRLQNGECPNKDDYRALFPDNVELVCAVFDDVLPAETPTEYQVLFGLLAYDLQYVNMGNLEDALTLWSSDQKMPVLSHFVNERLLDPQQCNYLKRAVVSELRRHQRDVVRALTYLATCLPHGIVHQATEWVGHQIRTFQASSPDNDAVPSSSRQDAARYSNIAFHAEGGLGRVCSAHDRHLGRTVAIKYMQRRVCGDPNARRRFLHEAHITAQLQHPNIVPIYDLITSDNGNSPYYVMRLIRGDTLDDAITSFHGTGPTPARYNPRDSSFRQLLQHFISVCNAVEYAHDHGVIHRDLKPKNIIVGKYGETLVLDWGLAKTDSQQDAPDSDANNTMTGLPETVPGKPMGTPAYMAPEQATGEIEEISVKSDVYGLGATLYYLLTGKPPFVGSTVDDVLAKVEKGDFVPPHQVTASVPSALSSICVKAMAKGTEYRYPSVGEFVTDLEHWLNDNPIACHQEQIPERLIRTARKHPTTVVSSSLAAVALGIITLIVAGYSTKLHATNTELDAKNVQLAQANTLVRANAQRARDNFRTAKTVVDDLTDISEQRLASLTGVQSIRRDILTRSLQYYEDFISQYPDDAELTEDLAAAYFRVGRIGSMVGSLTDALKTYQSAEGAYRSLIETEADNPEHRRDLAATLSNMGTLHSSLNQNSRAHDAFGESITIQRQVTRDYPDMVRYELDLSVALNAYANSLQDTEPHKSLAYYDESIDVLKRLTDQEPDMQEYSYALGSAYNDRAHALRMTGNRPKAMSDLTQSIRILSILSDNYPRNIQYLTSVSNSYVSIARLLIEDTERQEDAMRYAGKAHDIMTSLSEENTDVKHFRVSLAKTWHSLGQLYAHTGNVDAAIVMERSGAEMWESLLQNDGSIAEYRVGAAKSSNNLGHSYRSIKDHENALREYKKSVALWEKLVDDYPTKKSYEWMLGDTYNGLGTVYYTINDNVNATTWFNRAAEHLERASARQPDIPLYQQRLGGVLCNLGHLAKRMQSFDQAIECYDKADARLTVALRLDPDDVGTRSFLHNTHMGRADCYLKMGQSSEAAKSFDQAIEMEAWNRREGRPAVPLTVTRAGTYCDYGNYLRKGQKPTESLKWFEEAIALLGGIAKEHPDNSIAPIYLRNSYWGRAVALNMLGRCLEGRSDLERADELLRDKDPGALYAAACVYGLSALGAAKAPGVGDVERAHMVEHCAGHAVECLRKAHGLGLFDNSAILDYMLKDEGLEAIRERSDYKDLLEKIREKTGNK